MKNLIISLLFIFYINGVIAQIDSVQLQKLYKGKIKPKDYDRYKQVFNSKWEILGTINNNSLN